MYLWEAEIEDSLDIISGENSDKYQVYFHEIMSSNLSILKIYISLCKSNHFDIKIKARVNNNYYCNCVLHNAKDLPFRILDDKKIYCCYGCGCSGTIISLISKFYYISLEESIESLHAYINKDINTLSIKQLDILNEIFQYYDSPTADMIFEKSRRKTELLNERIKRYIDNNDSCFGDEEKIAKRLCCSNMYVKRFLPMTNNDDSSEFVF